MFPVPMSTSRRSLDVVAVATLDRRRDLEARMRDVVERYNRVKNTLDAIVNKASGVLQLGVEPLLDREQLASHHNQLNNTIYFLEDMDFFCLKYVEETWPDDTATSPPSLQAIEDRNRIASTWHTIEVHQGPVIREEVTQTPPADEPLQGAIQDLQRSLGLQQASCGEVGQRQRTSTQNRTSDRREGSGDLSSRLNAYDPVQGSGPLRRDTPPNLLDTLSDPAACTQPLVPLGARKKKRDNELLIDFSSNSSVNKTPERTSPSQVNKNGQSMTRMDTSEPSQPIPGGTSSVRPTTQSSVSLTAPPTTPHVMFHQEALGQRPTAKSATPTTQALSERPMSVPPTSANSFGRHVEQMVKVGSCRPASVPPASQQLAQEGRMLGVGAASESQDVEAVSQSLIHVEITEDGDAGGTLKRPQSMLELDRSYSCIVTHVTSPSSFYVITMDFPVFDKKAQEMNAYYSQRHTDVRPALADLLYCAVFENAEWFRCMIVDKQENSVSVYFMDYGGITENVPLKNVQPLVPQFCTEPPYARQCHLVGVEPVGDEWAAEATQMLMDLHCSYTVTITVEDNSSESLGVRLRLPTDKWLHDLLLERHLATPHGACSLQPPASWSQADGETEEEAAWQISDRPEHSDALEAVQGYSNRDEAEICKHYKGPPATTCFKGMNCKKRHVLMDPDGWTLDRQDADAYAEPLPLPAAGSSLAVEVTHVDNYRLFYVHLLENANDSRAARSRPDSLLPASLEELVARMNSAEARAQLRPPRSLPALGELLAAVYPDGKWYRAQALDVPVENRVLIRYVDFGNRCWVECDTLRRLEPQFLALPFQAVPCQLADVVHGKVVTDVGATTALRDTIDQKRFAATVVSVVSTESLLLELTEGGFSVAETLALQHPQWFTWQPTPRRAAAD